MGGGVVSVLEKAEMGAWENGGKRKGKKKGRKHIERTTYSTTVRSPSL